jgi:Tol biopolymer transport system component
MLLLAGSLALATTGCNGDSDSKTSTEASAVASTVTSRGAVVLASDHGIYATNVGKRELTELTRDGYDSDPSWSPDAKRIVFSRIEDDGDNSVLVMSANGRGLHRLATGKEPVWSPDGTRIAFSGPLFGDALYVVSANGSGLKRVATSSEIGFSWSPDSTRIAYSDGADHPSIQIADVATGESQALSEPLEYGWRLAWSPDGSKIAFAGDGLDVIDPSSGHVDKLTEMEFTYTPAWSPDSKRIAFLRDGALWTIGSDGGDERRLASVGDLMGGQAAASWSADGQYLFYERRRFPGSSGTDIWRVRVDGTHAKPITHAFPTGASFSSPDWGDTTIRHRAEDVFLLSLRPTRVVVTPTTVLDLSADQGRFAVIRGAEFGSGPMGVTGAKGHLRWLRGSADWGNADGTGDLVLAGGRAAWTGEATTSSLDYTTLFTGMAGTGAAELVTADHNNGLYLGGLAGDRSLLVYNTWRESWPKGYEHPSVVSEPKLWRIVGAGSGAKKRLVIEGPDAADVVAVDTGRIAVLRHDGMLVILNATGRKLSAFHLGSEGLNAAQMTESTLVVLRGRMLEVRDVATGTLRHRWRTANGSNATLEDASNGFAVYSVGIAVHLLRLSDGRDRTLSIRRMAGPVNAQLEPEGLYVSYNLTSAAHPGRIAFVPFLELNRRIR